MHLQMIEISALYISFFIQFFIFIIVGYVRYLYSSQSKKIYVLFREGEQKSKIYNV